MLKLGIADIKNGKISDLIEWFAKKTQLDHLFSSSSILSNSIF